MQKVFFLTDYSTYAQVDIEKLNQDIEENVDNLDSISDLYTSNLDDLMDSLVFQIFIHLDKYRSHFSIRNLLELNKRRFTRLSDIDRREIWIATMEDLEKRSLIDSSSLAFAINSLVEWYAHIKEKDLAKEQFIKVIGLFPERSLELESEYSNNNLGTILNLGGDPGAGIPFLKQTIRIFSHHLGEDHQYISVMLNNIGMAYVSLKQGDWQKEYLLKALAIRSEK